MTAIGVLTRHCYPNYGSLLQAMALAIALSEEGGDVRIIDYVPRSDSEQGIVAASLGESRMRGRLLDRAAFVAIQGPNLRRMVRVFREYQQANLTLSPRTDEADGVAAQLSQVDCVVAGSDQVWNTIHGKVDPVYYLASAPPGVKRFSYAASFGTGRLPLHAEPLTLEWIRKLDSVSVREPSAVTALAAHGVQSRVDVDPVLLLGREYWDSFAGEPSSEPGSYVLVYQLHNTPGFQRRAERVAMRRRLPVRRVTADFKQRVRHPTSDYLAPPEAFVRLLRDSAHVVTDSFHGTAFSLMFGRPLDVVLPERNSVRLTDIVAAVGLSGLISGDQHESDYNGAAVLRELDGMRRSSREYLRELVQGLK